jgi:hypothetical protein
MIEIVTWKDMLKKLILRQKDLVIGNVGWNSRF